MKYPLCLLLACTSAMSFGIRAQTVTPPPASTLSTGTQLVVVDVTVQDRAGKAVHGLKPTDFMLEEGKTPQVVKSFDEHTTAEADAAAKHLPVMPAMPPGTFTNFTPVPDTPALNILLLDSLNTPMKDQSFVRYELQQYVKHLAPGARVAIFGLSHRLIILQGFTSDPEVLKAAVQHKLIPRASPLLDDPVGTNADTTSLSDVMGQLGAGAASATANLQQFEAETASFQVQLRMRYTLDAFNALSRYLVQFPGRKNLIWFSGAFPLNILPDADLQNPFGVVADATDEFRETTNLLNRARVAVYPVDARGLQTLPMFEASQSGSRYARNPGAMGKAIAGWTSNNAQEHMTMDQLAEETGGKAFYNTNGLSDAVAKAVDAGSNFYTMTYSPSNRKWNGEFRSIHVTLQGSAAAAGYKLSFRHGYYADDPGARRTKDTSSVMSASAAAGPVKGTDGYMHAAMQRAAPTPSEILFKVRVLPDVVGSSPTVVEGNSPDPSGHFKAPYRTYDVDYVMLPRELQLKLDADGRRHGAVQFITFVYDPDGALLNVAGATVTMDMADQTYAAAMKSGLHFRQQVSAPARGESFLRIGVHDPNSGKFGVVEIPASAVNRLQPPPPPVAPAAQKPADGAGPAASGASTAEPAKSATPQP